MNRKIVLIGLLLAGALGGCSEDRQTVTVKQESPRFEFSYPHDGQRWVSSNAPLVLRFSHSLVGNADHTIRLHNLDNDKDIPFVATFLDDKHTLRMDPVAPLPAGQEFQLQGGEIQTSAGLLMLPEQGIRFTTRPRMHGGKSQVSMGDFRVQRLIPDGKQLPLMDFSTIRLQFTQPLDRSSLEYGQNIALLSEGNLLSVELLVRDHLLSIVPEDELQPGIEHRLILKSDIRSIEGERLEPGLYSDWVFVPGDSRPRSTMVQRVVENHDGKLKSSLSGLPVNQVRLKSSLLGRNDPSVQFGNSHAELAYLVNHPEVTPLRIPRGTLMTATEVPVRIAGQVSAGFSSGKLQMQLISDATGFLLPNQYSDDPAAPKQLLMFMDLAMAAEEPRTSSAITQDILHVEVVGVSSLQDGGMALEAMAMIEPEIQGLEHGWSLMSLRLESWPDQNNVPAPEVDDSPLSLMSWVPGNQVDATRPGDPVVLTFNRRLNTRSLGLPGALWLTEDDAAVNVDWFLDGTSLIIQPENGLLHGRQYHVNLSGAVTDLQGHALSMPVALSFQVPPRVTSEGQSPVVLSTYPGFPCATIEGNPSAGIQGRCLGGQEDDDLLPVMPLPANRPISVVFSQPMDEQSIALDGSFVVEYWQQNQWRSVPGRLHTKPYQLMFYPHEPWREGEMYRYILRSNDDAKSAQVRCDGAGGMCSKAGLPLQTALLAKPKTTGGGPAMEIVFTGAPATDAVLQVLRNLPTADVNADFIHQEAEQQPQADPDSLNGIRQPANATRVSVLSVSGAISRANIGCGFDGLGTNTTSRYCPEKAFTYANGAVHSEVVGYDAGRDAVQVRIYPGIVYSTSLDTHVGTFLERKVESTGPQMMRMRYQQDNEGLRSRPIEAWIKPGTEGPQISSTIEFYRDAPYFNPDFWGISLPHNQISYPLTIPLKGRVNFLDDGRMQIQQSNTQSIPIEVRIWELGFLGVVGSINLEIPTGSLDTRLMSIPIKSR